METEICEPHNSKLIAFKPSDTLVAALHERARSSSVSVAEYLQTHASRARELLLVEWQTGGWPDGPFRSMFWQKLGPSLREPIGDERGQAHRSETHRCDGAIGV